LNRSTPWLQCRKAGGDSRLRLFCLPHAGSGASTFHPWSSALPAFVQICPVQLPGRESRISEPLYTGIEPLVDAMDRELQPWLDIPYAIFGHSMGALLAFEWARRLQRKGSSMPAWLFLSGRSAPDLSEDTKPQHSLSDREFVEKLTSLYNGIPREFLRDQELMEVFLPILRADFAVVESYRFREDKPLGCPITVFAGSEDATVTWDRIRAWKRQAGRSFAIQLFPGGHFYPHPPLLRAISSTLTELTSQCG